MACTRDVCWSNAAELFHDVDFDLMYSIQQRTICGGTDSAYPYVLLVYTGKITIAINLDDGRTGHSSDRQRDRKGEASREAGRSGRPSEDITE
jgi:hypothetical protein